jgi:hypothetical protein
VELLARDYDLTHEVIVYKAATLPMQQPRMDRMPLGSLPEADIDMHATLVVPPCESLEPNQEIRERLRALDAVAT